MSTVSYENAPLSPKHVDLHERSETPEKKRLCHPIVWVIIGVLALAAIVTTSIVLFVTLGNKKSAGPEEPVAVRVANGGEFLVPSADREAPGSTPGPTREPSVGGGGAAAPSAPSSSGGGGSPRVPSFSGGGGSLGTPAPSSGGGGNPLHFAPAPQAPAPRGCAALFTNERCVDQNGPGWAVSWIRIADTASAATASNCCVQVIPDADLQELENNYRQVTINGSGNYCYLRSVLLSLVVQVSARFDPDATAFGAFRHQADRAFSQAQWTALFASEGVEKANVLAQLANLRMMNPTDRNNAVAQGQDHNMMQLLKFARVIASNGDGFGSSGGAATHQTKLAKWFNLSAYSIPQNVAATREVGLTCVGVCPHGKVAKRLDPNAANQQVFIKTANGSHFNTLVSTKVLNG